MNARTTLVCPPPPPPHHEPGVNAHIATFQPHSTVSPIPELALEIIVVHEEKNSKSGQAEKKNHIIQTRPAVALHRSAKN